jgi:hypothetical protein
MKVRTAADHKIRISHHLLNTGSLAVDVERDRELYKLPLLLAQGMSRCIADPNYIPLELRY